MKEKREILKKLSNLICIFPLQIILRLVNWCLSDYRGLAFFGNNIYIFLLFFVGLLLFGYKLKWKILLKNIIKNNSDLPKKYWQLNFFWIILGCLAFIAMIIIFYLMVFKPIWDCCIPNYILLYLPFLDNKIVKLR